MYGTGQSFYRNMGPDRRIFLQVEPWCLRFLKMGVYVFWPTWTDPWTNLNWPYLTDHWTESKQSEPTVNRPKTISTDHWTDPKQSQPTMNRLKRFQPTMNLLKGFQPNMNRLKGFQPTMNQRQNDRNRPWTDSKRSEPNINQNKTIWTDHDHPSKTKYGSLMTKLERFNHMIFWLKWTWKIMRNSEKSR